MGQAPTLRRTQEARSAGTQAALIDAAIESLIQRGWAATTAARVCDDAGVTRGALLHHYPNLGGLLAAALGALHHHMLAAAGAPSSTVRGAVDTAWRAIGDRRFKAVMEAWWAAGNDPDLAREIGPVVAQFAGLVSPTNSTSPRFRQPAVATFLLTAREALFGLAMGRATSGGRPLGHERSVLAALRQQASALDSQHSSRRPHTTGPAA
jgi:AcrR family transcriptional regulator